MLRYFVAVRLAQTPRVETSLVWHQLRLWLSMCVRTAANVGVSGLVAAQHLQRVNNSAPDTNHIMDTMRVLVLWLPRAWAWGPCGWWMRRPSPRPQRLSSGLADIGVERGPPACKSPTAIRVGSQPCSHQGPRVDLADTAVGCATGTVVAREEAIPRRRARRPYQRQITQSHRGLIFASCRWATAG